MMVRNGVINIVSRHILEKKVRGPRKVVANLVRGLNRIGQAYVVNHPLRSTDRLWIHDDVRALARLPESGTSNILGPNLVVLPKDLPTRRLFPHSFYLQPSKWVADMWLQEGFAQCAVRVWPVGIDTDEFSPNPNRGRLGPVLLYFKRRRWQELAVVERALEEFKLRYVVLRYGYYDEERYKRLLSECSFVVWLGCHESQGIALQEALAMDVPVLVVDAQSLFDEYPPANAFPEQLRSLRVTSAPYFDARCGLVVDSVTQVREGINFMLERYRAFHPREFVLENLSLERQARNFVRLFEELEGTR